jgi:pimeloyl-ACP methyl ester carboxylesterase
MKRVLKWAGIALSILVLAVLLVPFAIPVKPLEGLASPRDLAGSGDSFITLPFEGTDGVDIRYVEAGDPAADRTFILIHGSVFNAATWDEVMDDFATRGRVIAYDRLPYGLSEKLQPGDWSGASPLTPTAAVDRVITLMDALGIERAVLVGNSYGSVVATRAAAAYPERIEALVLGDAAVYVDENMPGWLMRAPQVTRLGPLLARGIGSSEAFVKATWAHPEAMSAERLAKTLSHTGVEGWDSSLFAYLQTWVTPDMAPIIAEVSQPTLVITGDSDTVVPVEDSERLHEAVAGSEYAVLPDCGHVPQEECPEIYAEAVLGWIDSQL